ncbi:MAG: polysaccharide biosynthesis tyrosine autokinase [Anaerolineae bacterium]
MDDLEGIDLAIYFHLFRKWLWLMVLCAVVAGGAAYLVSINIQPIYQATTTMLLERGGLSPSMAVWGDNQWESMTYVELLPRILPETAARLGLPKIDERRVTVEAVEDTRVIRVRARDVDPQRAANIANTIPEVFADYMESLRLDRYTESKAALSEEMERLDEDIEATQERIRTLGEPQTPAEETEMVRLEETLAGQRYNYGQLLTAYETMRLAEMQAKGSLVVFKSASVPTSPVLPKTRQNVVLAAAAGAMLAMGGAFLMEYLDDTFKTPEDVADVLGLTTLGSIARLIPERRGDDVGALVTATMPLSPVSEAFRALRTNLRFANVDRPVRRLLVTSSDASEGKSLVAANLAVVFAQAGRSVILVDADLRRPSLQKVFDLSQESGLTDCLVQQTNLGLNGHLAPTQVENLRLLPPGMIPLNPSELLGSQRMSQIIEQLEQEADMIIFDTPPVLAVTDAAVLSQKVDGVILVVEAGNTQERASIRALTELAQVEAPVLGAVLNKIPTRGPESYRYYYYRYAYGDDQKQSGFRLNRLWRKIKGGRKDKGGRMKDEG